MIALTKVEIIHPINEDLRFLRKLRRNLVMDFPDYHNVSRLSNNSSSHEKALSAIGRLSPNDVVLFLCHGTTRALYGAEYRAPYGAHPRRYVHSENHGYLIDKDNIDLLAEKKIICVACNSNSLSKLAIDAGATVFIGFDQIDFDVREELLADQKVRNSVSVWVKYGFRRSLQIALSMTINENLNFYQFKQLLEISLNHHTDHLMLSTKDSAGRHYYKSAALCLQQIRDGIQLDGDGNTKFLD